MTSVINHERLGNQCSNSLVPCIEQETVSTLLQKYKLGLTIAGQKSLISSTVTNEVNRCKP